MMSIGLHPRLVGQAGRTNALREIIESAQAMGGVWFCRRIDVARLWLQQHPPPDDQQTQHDRPPASPETGVHSHAQD
jgi:hypothetical protein